MELELKRLGRSGGTDPAAGRSVGKFEDFSSGPFGAPKHFWPTRQIPTSLWRQTICALTCTTVMVILANIMIMIMIIILSFLLF